MPNLYSNFNIVLLQVSGINWEKSREKSKTLLNLERSYAGLRGVKKQKFIIKEHKNADSFISVKMDYADDIERVPDRVTYKLIQDYIEDKHNFKVHTAYIAEVKRSLGLPMNDAPNAVEELKYPYKQAPAYKVEAIKDALKHFNVI